MKIWTTDEEATKLTERFQGINRAAFARENKVAGGQAMIYQHMNALRKIGLEAALAYAKGFGCSLEEISPRLAEELRRAVSLSLVVEPADPASAKVWPFPSISPERYAALSDHRKGVIEGRALAALEEQEALAAADTNSRPKSSQKVRNSKYKDGIQSSESALKDADRRLLDPDSKHAEQTGTGRHRPK